MGVLEQVTELKGRGIPENEIVTKLSQNGVSPNEINDALNQSKIKSAVSSEEAGTKDSGGGEGMEPSIMGEATTGGEGEGNLPTENISDVDLSPPEPSSREFTPGRSGPATREMDQENSQEYTPQAQSSGEYSGYSEAQYPSASSSYEDYNYAPAQTGDADTMIEIAEQVFFEKIKSIKKQVEDFSEFKTLSQVKIDNISERLKRIEMNMDRLQAEILEKVGSYGRGIESVKGEMEMMQDSFGKIVNQVADSAEHRHQTHHTPTPHPTRAQHTTHTRHKVTHKPKKTTKSKAKKSTRKKR
ncbi:MAG: hypothetical protein KJ879_03515 [Nanoarchaeota archaeon]|nr:hypothetical protein [Nanoarchaeota archaeon]